ncbi:MAG: hypothetical protein J0H74_30735 [Chitinophagaceae bacterium]|nr:hypothetical protein [Chitinophagaceae bacterium]
MEAGNILTIRATIDMVYTTTNKKFAKRKRKNRPAVSRGRINLCNARLI